MSVEPIEARARGDLRLIRQTMERAGAFTAVPGRGGIAMGVVGLGAALAAARAATPTEWLLIWLGAAGLGFLIGIASIEHKARTHGGHPLRPRGRRFLLGLAPPLLAGAILTFVLWRAGLVDSLPGLWLLLYGAGVVTGGTHAVRELPIMGGCLMLLGLLSLTLAPAAGNWLLGVGFGGLQIFFGIVISRRHGG